MAISATLKKAGEENSTTTTSVVPTATVSASKVCILACSTGEGTNKLFSSVADDAGNTWTIDQTENTGTKGLNFASSQLVTDITVSNTVTITWDVATLNECVFYLLEVSGLAQASIKDKYLSSSGSGTSYSTGPTAQLSQAEEICIALLRTGAGGWNPDPAWTSLGAVDVSGCQYLITSSVDGVTAAGTVGNASWSQGILTYKGDIPNQVMLPMGMLGTGRV